jgi:hypothetical protein
MYDILVKKFEGFRRRGLCSDLLGFGIILYDRVIQYIACTMSEVLVAVNLRS